MRADLDLKTKQTFWETPKAIAIIVATTAAIFTALAGFAGYKLGSQPPQTDQRAPRRAARGAACSG